MTRPAHREPKFTKGQRVLCCDADAREFAGAVLFHYAGRGGWWYAVAVEEVDAVLHFPESRISADPAAVEAEPTGEALE